jgi:hypothetical protein
MTTVQPELEKMEALMEEMSITIRNLASLASAHGLLDPYMNHHLHDAIEGGLQSKPYDETMGLLKKVNEGVAPDWTFLHVG